MIKWLLLGVILCTGCGSETENRERDWRALRDYKTSSLNVRYFIDCIEGYRFVITHAGHGMVAAGPIGECVAP